MQMFLLRPDPVVNQIIEYLLAEAGGKFGVEVVAYMVMSNHVHILVFDRYGFVSEFMQRFFLMSALALNRYWGRSEGLWSSEAPNLGDPIERQDVLGQAIYALANPVAAQLVTRAADWPGASSIRMIPGEKRVIARPKGCFFAENGTMPRTVVLETVVPEGWDTDGWVSALREGVAEAEEKAERHRARTGARVLGRKGVLRQSPFDRPKGVAKRRKLIPEIACKNPQARIAAVEELRRFRAQYAWARDRFREGMRDVVFPAGTCMMVRRYGVAVAPS